MKIEIWSDVACPFCYIGKHHLAQALAGLSFKNEVNIIWKSYLLNPDYQNTQHESIYDYLAENKGISKSEAKQMTQHVADMALKVGLKLNFDTNIPANTFKAHLLLHFANQYHVQNQVKERLFEAHFTNGEDIADEQVLIQIAREAGLNETETLAALRKAQHADAVHTDVYESKTLGIRGVPYFIIDGQYALSGAQPVNVFIAALEQAYASRTS